jgi:SET domain-containing protein
MAGGFLPTNSSHPVSALQSMPRSDSNVALRFALCCLISTLCRYTGELLRPRVSDLREMRYRAEGLHSTYFFRLDGSLVIDATRKGNVARYVNHSCGPNCEPRLVVADGKHHIVLISKTAIRKGEELCYDYKLPLDGTEQPCLYVSLPVLIISSCKPYF